MRVKRQTVDLAVSEIAILKICCADASQSDLGASLIKRVLLAIQYA